MTARLSPFDKRHRSLDATLTEFAGWAMPLRYDSELAEHDAVRSAAGLFDLSHMGEIRVSGRDAASAMSYCVTGDMAAMEVGRAKYTLICTPEGGVIDDLIVYREEHDSFLIVANAANAARVLDEVSVRVNSYDCIVADDSAATALVAVQGPSARRILEQVVSEPERIGEMRYFSSLRTEFGDRVPVTVARTGYTGEDGFEVFVQVPDALDLWDRLMEAGDPLGMIPAGLAARDTLRLEAGMPLYGNELNEGVRPAQAGLGWAVNLGPEADADFVGAAALRESKETVAQWRGYAVTAPDDARLLVGLIGEGRRAARGGYEVMNERGEAIGQVTSGALSPSLGRPVAMAYVHPEYHPNGTRVLVDVRGRETPMTVVPLPFYRRAQ